MLDIGNTMLKEKKIDNSIKYYKEGIQEINTAHAEKGMEVEYCQILLGLCEAHSLKKEWKSVSENSKNVPEVARGWADYWRAKASYELDQKDEAKVYAKRCFAKLGDKNQIVLNLLNDLGMDAKILKKIISQQQGWNNDRPVTEEPKQSYTKQKTREY